MKTRQPLERDFTPRRRMQHQGRTVIYVGRSSTGAFVFEDGRMPNRQFLNLWPFQLQVEDTPAPAVFDEARWKRRKEEAEYNAWVAKVDAGIKKINTAIRTAASAHALIAELNKGQS